MNKAQIFRELYNNSVAREGYIDRVPVDIRDAISSNDYSINLQLERDMLLKQVFGEYTEAVEWFLYEWRPGFKVDDVAINSIDEYIAYMVQHEEF